MDLAPPAEDQFEDFKLTDELLSLLLKGAARRGYSDPEDYLVDLVESDLVQQNLQNEAAARQHR